MSVTIRTKQSDDSIEVVKFIPQKGNGNYEAFKDSRPEYPFIVRGHQSLFEAITPNSDGPHRQWKSFQHYKRVRIPPNDDNVAIMHPNVSLTEHGGYAGSWYFLAEHHDRLFGFLGFGSADNPTQGLLAMYDPESGDSDDFVPNPSDLDKLMQRALARMLPEVKAELSLVNSVIELKDFASLPRTLKELSSLPEKLTRLSNGITSLRMSPGKTLREILRAVSDVYLQKKFNIDPLLSDITNLVSAVFDLEKRVNALLSRNAKAQRKHFFMPLDEFAWSTDSYGPYGFPIGYFYPGVAGTAKSYRQVRSESSKFHVMIEYNFNYTQYQIEHARLLVLLDSLGVNLNPQIIWNAIPWSFVVDWVLGVSRWLGQFSIANMAPKINIRNCLWSIKRERRIDIQYDIGVNSFGYRYSPTINCGTFIETSYKRVVGMPSSSSILSSGLNSTEFSLGAALVLSRRRYPKTSRKKTKHA